jgi:glycerol uptake facilitator protein
MTGSLVRRCAAEALGTALLIVFGPGAVVAALLFGGGSLDFAGLGMIALSFGIVVAVVVYAFGTTSGAHINPAVTVALAATRRFPWRDVGPYVVAQMLGALAGGLVVVLVAGTRAVDLGSVGGVAFGPGVGYVQAVAAEAVATFLLLTAVMGLAVDRRAPVGWAGLGIGLSVTSLVIVFGPFTGAAVNPARAFGPLATASLFGGDVAWSQFPAYVVGPLLGALAGALAYDAVARPRDHEEAEPPQGLQGDVVGERS